MKKIICNLSVLLISIFVLSGCTSRQDTFVESGFYFDTIISIQITHNDGEALLKECFSLCDKMERIFSRTMKESEVYKINHRTSQVVEVSDEVAKLIQLGLQYGDLSQGLFDITVAPLSDLWDFKSENPDVPGKVQIEEALTKIDYRKIHIDGNTVSFDDEETRIDLGAIAKGYVADRLKELLVRKGVTSGIINLGGNVLTIGGKEEEKPWTVGIQKPFDERNETITTVDSYGTSVVSSGVYERYFKKNHTLYHHILNPKTGYPQNTDLWQATILSQSSVEGDLLSTTCMLLGREKAQELLENYPDVHYILVDNTGEIIK